jgi:hypothetical protein
MPSKGEPVSRAAMTMKNLAIPNKNRHKRILPEKDKGAGIGPHGTINVVVAIAARDTMGPALKIQEVVVLYTAPFFNSFIMSKYVWSKGGPFLPANHAFVFAIIPSSMGAHMYASNGVIILFNAIQRSITKQ